MASPGRRLQELVIYAILIVVGIGTCAWYGPGQLSEAKATADWPEVTGSIVAARPVSESGSRNRRSHSVAIQYTYKVGDQVHNSGRFSITSPNLGAESQAQAQQLARGYRNGDKIQVYYDPDEPGRAVLRRGGTGKAWMTIGFGALLLLVGLVMGAIRLLRG